MLKIEYHGAGKDVATAKKYVGKSCELSEEKARLKIQELIDKYDLKARIYINGSMVWSKKRIMQNLQRIINHGKLYGTRKPRYYPIGSCLKIPEGGKLVLAKYFYEFLRLHCGSIAHYNIYGWVATYPTLQDLKTFFKKNEMGQRVIDSIPPRHTDIRNIVESIEIVLFPFQSIMRARKTKQ
jgi:hypothetical protein